MSNFLLLLIAAKNTTLDQKYNWAKNQEEFE